MLAFKKSNKKSTKADVTKKASRHRFGPKSKIQKKHAKPIKRSFSTGTSSQTTSPTSEPQEPTHINANPNKKTPLTLADFPTTGAEESLFKQNLFYVSKSIFSHQGYNHEHMALIKPHHRKPRDFVDRWSLNALRLIRSSFDLATGYTHPPANDQLNPKYKMSTNQWMRRFLFLETIAAIPGLVAGMVRHLQSLRILRRDNGWIETLLDESYNERMHLLCFLELHKPGPVMKLLILFAQGIFFNCFFLTYLVAPKVCHRFVGYLEEEAVITYSRAINEIENGFYPEWSTMAAPPIAQVYWKMPETHSSFKDMLYYIRADEAQHCEVNHTFGNLDQGTDPNPYSLKYFSPQALHPSKDLTSVLSHPVGWERNEIEVDAALIVPGESPTRPYINSHYNVDAPQQNSVKH